MKQNWRALENVFDAIAITDASGILVYCNQRFRKLGQIDDNAVSDVRISLADMLELPQDCWAAAQAGATSFETPCKFRFRNGAGGFAQVIVDHMQGENSEAYMIFVLRDMTAETQSRVQLDENAHRLHELTTQHAEVHFLWRLAIETPIYLEPSTVISTIVKRLRDDLSFADACFLQVPNRDSGEAEGMYGDNRLGSRLREVAKRVLPSLRNRHARVEVSSSEVEPYGRFWITCFQPKLEKPFFLLARSEPSREANSHREFFESLGMQLTQWLDNRAMYVSSISDSLTGLFNRRHFDSRFAVECILARERRNILTLMMLDVDHFKQINDRYGHQAGDVVLKSLGETLKLTSRATDVPARVGGEEFAILLFDTSPEDARIAAEKIRQRIEETPIALPDSTQVLHVTVSCGIAGYLSSSDTPESVYAAADQALYQAKAEGRNRTVVSGQLKAKPAAKAS